MRKLAIAVFVILAGVCLYFLMSNLVLKQALSQIKETRDAELRQVLQQERLAILRDVEEKHKADMVSFEAMSKRMEIERERNRQLQEKLAK
jgi:hypothetical protein